MIQRTISILLILLVAGCAGDDLGDLNTEWTKSENDLFVKLNNVKAEYTTLRTRLNARGATVSDGTGQDLEGRLTVNERSIREMEDMIGRHRDARERAMEGGNADNMKTAWNSAKADYKGNMAKLDEIDRQRKELDGDIARLPKVDARNGNDRRDVDVNRRVDGDRDTALLVPNSQVDNVKEMKK